MAYPTTRYQSRCSPKSSFSLCCLHAWRPPWPWRWIFSVTNSQTDEFFLIFSYLFLFCWFCIFVFAIIVWLWTGWEFINILLHWFCRIAIASPRVLQPLRQEGRIGQGKIKNEHPLFFFPLLTAVLLHNFHVRSICCEIPSNDHAVVLCVISCNFSNFRSLFFWNQNHHRTANPSSPRLWWRRLRSRRPLLSPSPRRYGILTSNKKLILKRLPILFSGLQLMSSMWHVVHDPFCLLFDYRISTHLLLPLTGFSISSHLCNIFVSGRGQESCP